MRRYQRIMHMDWRVLSLYFDLGAVIPDELSTDVAGVWQTSLLVDGGIALLTTGLAQLLA